MLQVWERCVRGHQVTQSFSRLRSVLSDWIWIWLGLLVDTKSLVLQSLAKLSPYSLWTNTQTLLAPRTAFSLFLVLYERAAWFR